MARKATNKTNATVNEPVAKNVKTAQKTEKEIVKPVNVLADSEKKETKEPEVVKAEPAAAKKPAAGKTTTRKTTAKKTTTRKTTKKETTDVKADVFVQYQGIEVSEKAIMEKVVAAWEAEGKKASAIKRVKLYIKPEDGKAYYVINERLKNGSTGAVEL